PAEDGPGIGDRREQRPTAAVEGPDYDDAPPETPHSLPGVCCCGRAKRSSWAEGSPRVASLGGSSFRVASRSILEDRLRLFLVSAGCAVFVGPLTAERTRPRASRRSGRPDPRPPRPRRGSCSAP